MTTFFSACQKRYAGMPLKHVLVVWPLAKTDSVYQQWKPVLEDSFVARGLNVRIQHLHLNYYESGRNDAENRRFLDSALAVYERMGRRPDIVLLYGDETRRLVATTRGGHGGDLKYLFFGSSLIFSPEKYVATDRMTGFYDTVCLKENLDFMSRINKHSRLMVTQLDWGAVPGDDRRRMHLEKQMEALDTLRYCNMIGLNGGDSAIDKALEDGKIVFLALNTRKTYLNWKDIDKGDGFMVDNFFTDDKRCPNVIQVKYDVNCFSKRMHTPSPTFFTACPEHFSMGDSCIGGYFVPFDHMVSDVVRYSEAVLVNGTKLRKLPVRAHTGKGYYLNYDPFKRKGIRYDKLPGFAQIRGISFSDRFPIMSITLTVSLVLLLLLLVAFLSYFAYLETTRQVKLQLLKHRQAEDAIERRDLMHLILQFANASVFRVQNKLLLIDYSISPEHLNQSYSMSTRRFLELVLPYYRDEIERLMSIEEEGDYKYQFQIATTENEINWLEMRMRVTRGRRYDYERLGVFVFINEQKRKEAEMMEVHRRTVNAQERDNFIHEMNHQIRTPLNAIVGFSQLLTDPNIELDDASVAEFSESVRSANEFILDLIENMLTLAHLKNTNLHLDLVDTNIKDFVHGVCQKFDQRITDKGLRFIYSQSDENLNVVLDEKVVGIVLDKLLSNAIKFNKPAGSITVGWGRLNNITPYLFVEDTGIGIPKDKLGFIFKRFYKVDSFVQGTGLGLALAYELVQNMGGRLVVDSQVGVGTKFTLYFKN